jgi:hypothetical protein
MGPPKVVGIPTLGISRLPLWNPKIKWHLGVAPVAMHKIYYKGEGGGFPLSPSHGECSESVFARGLSVHQSAPTMH